MREILNKIGPTASPLFPILETCIILTLKNKVCAVGGTSSGLDTKLSCIQLALLFIKPN